MEWNRTQAKANFDEIVKRALTKMPQTIRHGDRRVVLIAETTYRLLLERQPTFKELLLNIPSLKGVDLNRDRSPMRNVDLR